MNGMTFGTEGPMMSGTWYNPNTGDAFTVRDSFFEDNQYIVTTTDGRYMRYEQLQNYVQTDMKLEDLNKMKNENSKKETALPAEVANLIEENGGDPYASMMTDDLMIGHNKPVSLGNLNDNRHTVPNDYKTPLEGPVKQNNMNIAIIEKALKNTTKPVFRVNIDWYDYPSKQIEMIMDVMDIPVSEIIDWYLDNIDMMEIVAEFKLKIAERLTGKKLYDQSNDLNIGEELEVKQSKPKKNSKSTKKS